MPHRSAPLPCAGLCDAFVALVGADNWATRLGEIARGVAAGPRTGQVVRQRHAIELAIERLRSTGFEPLSPALQRLADLAGAVAELHDSLPPAGRYRLVQAIQAGLRGSATLAPVFHLVRTARLQQRRGFAVHFAALCEEAPFDLLLSRHDASAELVCDTISAEAGREVQQSAWLNLAERLEPDLQQWLASRRDGYLLRLTLPLGLRLHPCCAEAVASPATLHRRICDMLASGRRREDDAAVVMRLDPLPFGVGGSSRPALLTRLRHQFGPETNFSATTGEHAEFALAARASRRDEIGAAIRRHMASVSSAHFTGTRPAILAMFVEDVAAFEWRTLREELELESETRNFLTLPEARSVVAVTCASRCEWLGSGAPNASAGGELRFRNPGHPAAHLAALAPALLSSV